MGGCEKPRPWRQQMPVANCKDQWGWLLQLGGTFTWKEEKLRHTASARLVASPDLMAGAMQLQVSRAPRARLPLAASRLSLLQIDSRIAP